MSRVLIDQTTIDAAVSGFDGIQQAIIDKGQDVPSGTPVTAYPDKIRAISGGGGTGEYQRPAAWLPIPEMDGSMDEIYILVAVFNSEFNPVSFLLSASGTISVDWGDGTSSTATTNAVVSHNYTWDSVSPGTYVPERGYRQALIKIQKVRGTIAGVRFSSRYPGNAWSNTQSTILQISADVNSITLLDIRGNTSSVSTTTSHSLMEIFTWRGQVNLTTLTYGFTDCLSLQVVELDASNVLITSYMFQNCVSMLKAPSLNLDKVTDARYMYSSCVNLRDASSLFLPNAINVTALFNGCKLLENAPGFVISQFVDAGSMYTGCLALITINGWNLSKATTVSAILNSCYSLRFLSFGGQDKAPTVSFSVFLTRLSASALNALFEELPVATTNPTITITSTPGAATCDRTIATNKGWTVTG